MERVLDKGASSGQKKIFPHLCAAAEWFETGKLDDQPDAEGSNDRPAFNDGVKVVIRIIVPLDTREWEEENCKKFSRP